MAQFKSIFHSWYSLSYNDSKIEEDYNKSKISFTRTLTCFITYTLIYIVLLVNYFEWCDNLPRILEKTIIIILLVVLIIFSISICLINDISTKLNFATNIVINLVTMFFFQFVYCIIYRHIYPDANLLILAVLLLITYRVITVTIYDNNYKLYTVSYLIYTVTYFSYFQYYSEPLFGFILYGTSGIFIFYIYDYEMREKTTFYLMHKLKDESNKTNDLINNLKNGIVSFEYDNDDCKLKNINYNIMIKQRILNNYNKSDYPTITDFNDKKDNTNYSNINMLYKIFCNLFFTNLHDISNNTPESIKTELYEIKEKFNEKLIQTQIDGLIENNLEIDYFKNIIKIIKDDNSNNFNSLGIKHIVISDEEYYYEIFVRYNSVMNRIDFIANDVSSILKFESYKAQMKYKTMYLAKICHEFKNPLINITELQHQLTQETKDNEQIEKLKDIKNLAYFMQSLISDFEMYNENTNNSNNSSNNIKVCNSEFSIKNLIDECAGMTESRIKLNSKFIIVKTDYENNMPILIESDEIKLRHVILNLLSNSFKFTNSGEIKIQSKIIKKEEDEDINNSCKLNIVITDTGIGFNSLNKSNHFQEITNNETKYNIYGTGMGLVIVNKLIDSMSGSFNIKSELNKGTSVSVTIPITYNKNANNKLKSTKTNKHVETVLVFNSSPVVNGNYDESLFNLSSSDLDETVLINNNINYFYKKTARSVKSEVIEHNTSFNNSDECLKISHNNVYKEFKEPIIELKSMNNKYRFIVVDDEKMIRQSHTRIIKDFFNKKGVNVDIIECADGAECLNQLYINNNMSNKIDAIFTDETMNLIGGSILIKTVNSLVSDGILNPIKLIMVTAYFNSNNSNKYHHINKPLSKNKLEVVYKDYFSS